MLIQPIDSTEPAAADTVGGKGSSLGRLSSAGFCVPDGIIVTTSLFRNVLRANGADETTQAALGQVSMSNIQETAAELRETVEGLDIPTNLRRQITESVGELSADTVAVRSSAVAEDSETASFAGLHDSKLNVPTTDPESVTEAVRACWKSLFSDRAMVYRLQQNLSLTGDMAVVVQEMVDSDVSGITFTTHPGNHSQLMIEASYGYGDIVVGGEVDPDAYRVDRDELSILTRTIGSKSKTSHAGGSGTAVSQTEASRAAEPALTDEEVTEVAKTCLEIERLFGCPQDIEWCIADAELFIVQSRAITTDAQ